MVLIYLDKDGKQQVMSVVSGSPLAFANKGWRHAISIAG